MATAAALAATGAALPIAPAPASASIGHVIGLLSCDDSYLPLNVTDASHDQRQRLSVNQIDLFTLWSHHFVLRNSVNRETDSITTFESAARRSGS